MRRALDFEHVPPAALPLRFLLTAPWFGVAAGLFAAWHGEAVFASRWSGATLAATHLITLGFLSMTMAGSLLQMLPVVAGLPLRLAGAATWAWPLLGAGTVLLAAAFVAGQPGLFPIAGATLATAFILLLACLLASLLRRPCAGHASVAHIAHAMRAAVLALSACLSAGLLLVAWLSGGPSVPALALTDTHAALGLAGWITLLVVGVSFQVLPMFQLTPVYPGLAVRWLAPVLIAALAWWLAARWLESAWRQAGALAGMSAVAVYVGLSLSLLARRRPGKRSATIFYWYLALGSLAAAAALFAWPGEASDARSLAIGVIFLIGFAMSVVNGMLYKIVPFLLWYHLQDRAASGTRVPKIGEFVGDGRIRVQFGLHLAAVAACLGACANASLARAAAILLALACLRLALDLARPALRHRACLTLQPS
jgi:hypothetical protein